MFKKILAFVLLSIIVSCGTSKPQIQTTKAGVAKNKSSRRTKASTRGRSRTATASNSKTTTNRTTETLESTSKTTVYSEQVSGYVMQYKDVAQRNMKNHGIPASITLAQGILESGAGRGTLAQNANNHFGIKCHNDWKGDKVYHDDDSAQECFRKYNDPAESFNDHSLFLTGRGRYAALFKLEKDDYEGWAKGLKAAGYATDPKYPDKLIGLIERFSLAQYDQEVLTGKIKPVKDVPSPTVTPSVPAVASTPKSVNASTPVTRPVVAAPAPVATTTAPSTSIEQAANTTGYYTVVKGDTLYSISKKNNVTVDQLIQLNGIVGNAISIGQVLKLK